MATTAEMQAQADVLGVSLDYMRQVYAESGAFETFAVSETFEYNKTLVASVNIASVTDAENNNALMSASNRFSVDQKGILEFNFRWLPFEAQAGGWADGILTSRGVRLWKPTEVSNGLVRVFFVTGFAPIFILLILIGAAIVIGATILSVSIFMVQQKQVDQYVDTQQSLQKEFNQSLAGLTPADQQKAISDRTKELANIQAQVDAASNPLSQISADVGKAVTPVLIVLLVVAGFVLIVPLLRR
jgi:hypothetical protein